MKVYTFSLKSIRNGVLCQPLTTHISEYVSIVQSGLVAYLEGLFVVLIEPNQTVHWLVCVQCVLVRAWVPEIGS